MPFESQNHEFLPIVIYCGASAWQSKMDYISIWKKFRGKDVKNACEARKKFVIFMLKLSNFG